jgi:peptide-methionine (S)-S-oxide reductase
MQGVIRTRVGYTGGEKKDPSYYSLGDHMEAIQIDYDPQKVDYEDLLQVFWQEHNPRSRPWKRQYASAIFYHDQGQKQKAQDFMARRAAEDPDKIYTELIPLEAFYRAENYHQKYVLRQIRDIMELYSVDYLGGKDFTDSTVHARLNGYLAGQGKAEDMLRELPLMGFPHDLTEKLNKHIVPKLARKQGAQAACPLPGN